MPSRKRVAALTAAAALPAALAYRFAIVYRTRAGFPRRHLPAASPSDVGLPFEASTIASRGAELPAWFIPANDGARGPGIVLVHGWESARDRMLPNARFLHAVGYHVLAIDVRGHGENPPEHLPISGGEFGADAEAGLAALVSRPEVTRAAILGHSMGGIGAILAAAADPRAEALIVVSAPADPVRLTRQTFRLARLPFPAPLAWPLAWLTTRVYVRPRRHDVRDISASRAIARFRGPILLIHGADDVVIPISHHHRLVGAARAGRSHEVAPAIIETLVVDGGAHSWLYEDESYRRAVAAFLARTLGGPSSADEAAERAAAVRAERLPDADRRFEATDQPTDRMRTLAELVGARAPRSVTEAPAGVPPDEPLAATDASPGPPAGAAASGRAGVPEAAA
jgi:pimeloyl-ACP methyl ester carboxylesterase